MTFPGSVAKRGALLCGAVLALSLVQCGRFRPGPAAPTVAIVQGGGAGAMAALRQRPFRLPSIEAGAPCPTATAATPSPDVGAALGGGPVYATVAGSGSAGLGVKTLNKVLWQSAPSYQGPDVIRAHELNGSHPVYLSAADQRGYGAVLASVPSAGMSVDLYGELDLLAPLVAGGAPGWRGWPSYTYVPAPGCYEWQVDGATFEERIVFAAVSRGEPSANIKRP